MKSHVSRTALAAAVSAALVGPLAIADDAQEDGTSVEINKSIQVNKDVSYEGDVSITGEIESEALGSAIVDSVQRTEGDGSDWETRTESGTNAAIDDDALKNGKGNIGVNAAAGDSNVQGNSAAVAAADADFVFGHGDAEVFAQQTTTRQHVVDDGGGSTAMLDGYALGKTRGNVGANVAAGVGNAQQNSVAIVSGADSLGEATVATDQRAKSNNTLNYPFNVPRNDAGMGDKALSGAQGNIGANVVAGDGNAQANGMALTQVGE